MKILAVGAHCDDIELSCLGTLLKLKNEKSAEISTVVCTGSEERKAEQRQAWRALGVKNSVIFDLEDGMLSFDYNLVSCIEDQIVKLWKKSFDIVLTHSPEDHHQDHQAVSKATQAVLRNSRSALIYYPSWNERIIFDSNILVSINEYVEQKQEILKMFKSQQDKHYIQSCLSDHVDLTEKFKLEFAYI